MSEIRPQNPDVNPQHVQTFEVIRTPEEKAKVLEERARQEEIRQANAAERAAGDADRAAKQAAQELARAQRRSEAQEAGDPLYAHVNLEIPVVKPESPKKVGLAAKLKSLFTRE